MLLWVLLLLPALVVFGFGFTMHTLLIAAVATLAIWTIALAMRAPRSSRRSSTRGHR